VSILPRYRGLEFADDPRMSPLIKAYVRLFGVPISGLRIRLRRILPAIRGDYQSIIDLGCGKGIFTFELAKRYPRARVVGVDLDEEQIRINRAIAEKRGIRNIEFQLGDILKMSFENEFDLALSVDNLEHIEDDVGALQIVRRALKPGGALVCHVPAYERIWLMRGTAVNFNVPGHVRPGYRRDELREKLTRAGFTVESVGHTYGYLETVTNNLSYLITGAAQKNKGIYAFAFPLLNAVAWLGRNQDPGERGAGVIAQAVKPLRS
jgi:SAM-dependent methyltransferase